MHEVQPQRLKGPPVYRLLGLVVLAVLLVAGGAVVFAGTPGSSGAGIDSTGAAASPGASTEPGASTAPDTSAAPGKSGEGRNGPGKVGRGGFPGRGFGGLLFEGRGAITIAGIAGTNLALETDDGWTRTIDTTGATITKDGTAITLADLSVGDTIRFAQTRNADGTYTVTEIAVVMPKVAGTVTEVSGSTITLSRRDGSTFVVHVGAGTTYQVPGVDPAALSDIAAGNIVVAEGTLRDDGSLDADKVNVFNGQRGDHGDRGSHPGRGAWGDDDHPADPADPEASPAPADTTSG